MGSLGLLLGARELGLLRFWLPAINWQVPAKWRSLPLHAMALGYAIVLGFGVANRIAAATFYEVVAWGVLSRSPLLGAVIFSGFGLGRSIPFILIVGQSKTADECFSLVEKADRLFPVVKNLNGLALASAGSYFLSLSWGLLVIGGKHGN